jgi:hypothetical protein
MICLSISQRVQSYCVFFFFNSSANTFFSQIYPTKRMFIVYRSSSLILVAVAVIDGLIHRSLSFTCDLPTQMKRRHAPAQYPISVATTPSSAEGISRVDDVADGNSSQQEYGKTLPLTNTYARCSSCQALFCLRPEDLGAGGKGR